MTSLGGGPLLFDVTALVAYPHRSGIQRVQREVLRHWPEPDRLTLCAFDPSGLVRQLPAKILDILCPPRRDATERRSFTADQQALARLLEAAPPLPHAGARHILNLELFYEAWRADTYRRLCQEGWRVQWLVYDFIPWLIPDLFPPSSGKYRMQYLRALRLVPEVAFISEQTRTDYTTRVMRNPARSGPVLPLGADGLALERQSWSPSRRSIVVVGTVERRKNPHVVADAFRRLWAQGVDAQLVFAGRVEDTQTAALRQLAGEAGARLQVLDEPSDDDLRAVLRSARAVLTASEVEGFGLPPYEALQSGIPAIAPASLPSVRLLDPGGRITLPAVTPEAIADAVRSIMDDDTARELWREAALLALPGWKDFAHKIARWTDASA